MHAFAVCSTEDVIEENSTNKKSNSKVKNPFRSKDFLLHGMP